MSGGFHAGCDQPTSAATASRLFSLLVVCFCCACLSPAGHGLGDARRGPGRWAPRPPTPHSRAPNATVAVGLAAGVTVDVSFLHGVASFDPLPHAVLLWTRCTCPPGVERVQVEWEVAGGPDGFSDPVARCPFGVAPGCAARLSRPSRQGRPSRSAAPACPAQRHRDNRPGARLHSVRGRRGPAAGHALPLPLCGGQAAQPHGHHQDCARGAGARGRMHAGTCCGLGSPGPAAAHVSSAGMCAPTPQVDELIFATVSCANWGFGWFHVYDLLSQVSERGGRGGGRPSHAGSSGWCDLPQLRAARKA